MFMITKNAEDMMNEMFNDMMTPFFIERERTFRTDIRETAEGFELTADMPGVKKENITIDVTGNMLTVSADFGNTEKTEKGSYSHIERRTGKMSRSFNVRGIEKENITAAYENGVLKLILPKQKKVLPETRHIAIGGSGSNETACEEKKEEGAA